MNSVCVFCGSSRGKRAEYADAARELGTEMARRSFRLVYGGSHVGLMGLLADACLAGGGSVVGVIPHKMVEREVAHDRLTELFVVDTMHERKAKMSDLADGFIAMPGGIGTLEEFFEIYTWGQLGYHAKPYCLLNAAGYYDQLLAALDHAVNEGFVKPAHRDAVLVSENPTDALDQLESHRPRTVSKWDVDETGDRSASGF